MYDQTFDEAILKAIGLPGQNSSSPQCTCKEFSKQRAICPVCDKEKFEAFQMDAGKLKSEEPIAVQKKFEDYSLTQQQQILDFEKPYGNNPATRTKKQWKNLLKKFGYALIEKTEGFTKRQIKEKCFN